MMPRIPSATRRLLPSRSANTLPSASSTWTRVRAALMAAGPLTTIKSQFFCSSF